MWLICISVFASHDNCWCDSELNINDLFNEQLCHIHQRAAFTPMFLTVKHQLGPVTQKVRAPFCSFIAPPTSPLTIPTHSLSVHLMNAWNHGSIWFFFTFILSLACYLQTGVEHATVQRTHVSGSLRVRHTGEGDVTHGGHFCRSAA